MKKQGRQEKDLNEYKRMFAEQRLKPTKAPFEKVSKSTKLIVSVRKRPLLAREKEGLDCVSVSNPTVRVHECNLKVDLTKVVNNTDFKFDYAFGDQDSTDAVYSNVVKPLIPLVLDKGTVTIFAYGQTGSGKTYTMEGIQKAAISDIFKFSKNENKLEYYVSYFEIYYGKVFDLLNNRQSLVLLENANKIIQVKGLSEQVANSPEGILKVINFGNTKRSTSPTVANDTSSRSHAICQIKIMKDKTVMGNLLLIDLAGSEKAQIGQANNRQRRLEGMEINKSLLALKECIRAIDAKGPHVPYRASKLTMVLRESFTGSGEKNKIVMIACVSPGIVSTGDTLNTLLYANRLKENKPTITEAIPIKVEEFPVKIEEVPEEKEEQDENNQDLNRLMTTLLREDKATFIMLKAAEEVNKGSQVLVKAHERYLKKMDKANLAEKALSKKLKDLEENDIDECVKEMEFQLEQHEEAQRKLKSQIALFKKKLHKEEESSIHFMKLSKN
jgi:kinesin family protein 2/24